MPFEREVVSTSLLFVDLKIYINQEGAMSTFMEGNRQSSTTSHFTNEETEAQRGEGAESRSQGNHCRAGLCTQVSSLRFFPSRTFLF